MKLRWGRTPEPTAQPTRFGPYELRWEIGSGGMATVHVASLPGPGGFEKLVCIKRIRPEMSENPEWIESFVNEAKLAALIHHPNVVQVTDLGCVDGTYYLAMEYIAGIDLLTVLRTAGRRGVLLPIVACAYLVRELCEGLSAAHRQSDLRGRPLGIVHRDVSPQNVLVSYEGQVKITDFGVAKSRLGLLATNPGTVKGKPNYMAPEQARGEAVDARTDVFAAGILLHELVSGEPFYPVADPARLIALVRKKPSFAALSSLRDDAPPALDAIASRALAFEPSERFSDAEEMSLYLSEVIAHYDPRYGAEKLAGLLEWLFDEAEAEEAESPRSPDAPMESAPTRVATAQEILQRRMRRSAGLHVKPAPPGVRSADASRPGYGRRLAELARRLIASDDKRH
jgi:serine/threonine-protein kinase